MKNLSLIFNMINHHQDLKKKKIIEIFIKSCLEEMFGNLKTVFVSKCTHQHSAKAEKRKNKNKSKLCPL